MSRKLTFTSAVAALLGSSAIADIPTVSADIAPLHSLVASVMKGVGVPNLIIPPGSSPHEHQLRPSEARAMQEADVFFRMGESLTPWMESAVESLLTDASITSFLDNEKTSLLEFREGTFFEAQDHGDDHDDHDGHDDHDDDHGHGSHDPHAWLSPNNAKEWLNIIAAQLSSSDPGNAATYSANAISAQSQIADAITEINATLAPHKGKKFVVFHDSYQYFEKDFDFPASGAISMGDASDPSPARIAEIQKRISNEKIDCVLAEPQYKVNVVQTVMQGSQANTNVIDPLGVGLNPGPELYNQLLRNMAKSLADCFK